MDIDDVALLTIYKYTTLKCSGKASIDITRDLMTMTASHNHESEEDFIECRSVERKMKENHKEAEQKKSLMTV